MQTDADTPTKPVTPVSFTSNGFRRANTGSDEEQALIRAGYSVIEHDGTVSLLRRARRASDHQVTNGDLAHYRALERRVFEDVASEMSAALTAETGVQVRVEASALRWAMDECKNRIMRGSGIGKTVVSGRIR